MTDSPNQKDFPVTNKNVGTHALSDIYLDSDSNLLSDVDVFEELLKKVCVDNGATVISDHKKTFDTGGFTLTLHLAESHASVHTWPEYGMVCMDIFMCGDCDAHETMRQLYPLIEKAGNKITHKMEQYTFRGFVRDVYI
jgi:S-adenosylmethionine decarboxylase proenzyme